MGVTSAVRGEHIDSINLVVVTVRWSPEWPALPLPSRASPRPHAPTDTGDPAFVGRMKAWPESGGPFFHDKFALVASSRRRRDRTHDGGQTGDFFKRTSGTRETPAHLPNHPKGGSPARAALLSALRPSTLPLLCSMLTVDSVRSLSPSLRSSCARYPLRLAATLGSIQAYSSRCARRAAARRARPPPRGARARRACSMTPVPGRLWSVACDRMSCASSGGPVTLRLRVGGVLRCAQSHRARSETRVAVLYFFTFPHFRVPRLNVWFDWIAGSAARRDTAERAMFDTSRDCLHAAENAHKSERTPTPRPLSSRARPTNKTIR